MPRLDIESIGSGGGSIVWVDEHAARCASGPRAPAPLPARRATAAAATRPTVTDATWSSAATTPTTSSAASCSSTATRPRAALEPVAGAARAWTPVEAADGALRIVESQMADLMRQMTVERGLDPRDFVVYAFGGAGGAHAVEFARELGCRQVVVPLGDLASTWSALGVMSSDVLHVHERSELVPAPVPGRAG